MCLQTVDSYLRAYGAACAREPLCLRDNEYHAYAYDGLWTLAVSLDIALYAFEF